MSKTRIHASIGLCACALNLIHLQGAECRGSQFQSWTSLSAWTQNTGPAAREQVFTSQDIPSAIGFDELVVSWNVRTPAGTGLRIEAGGVYPAGPTRFYALGLWSGSPSRFPRESVPGQKDADAEVQTDTLVLARPCGIARLRLTLVGDGTGLRPSVLFLGLSLLDTKSHSTPLPPNRAAWGTALPVPVRSQMHYPGGENSWCSPTSTSMVLAYWAKRLGRPGLDHDVPDVVQGVFDRNWPGTGNWPFNTAFAGSLPGLRAYVTRLTDVSELEDWIAAGIPVVVSVSYDLLRGKPQSRAGDGHLVVCVGFTCEGNVLVNDPGVSKDNLRMFPRQDFTAGWAHSHNTVYLIYPEGVTAPIDRFQHWASSKP